MQYEFAIEAGKVHEFARATHASSESYYGYWAIIPPTLLTVRAFWQPTEIGPMARLGLDHSRTLHAGEEVTFSGSVPRAEERLIVTSRLGEEWRKQKRRSGSLRFVSLITEYRDAEGNLVAETRATLVETGKPPEGAAS